MFMDLSGSEPSPKRIKISQPPRPSLHIEVCLHATSVLTDNQNQDLISKITTLARSVTAIPALQDTGCFFLDTDSDEYLKQHVDYARISDLESIHLPYIMAEDTTFNVHVYKLEEDEGAADTEEGEDGSVVNACEVMLLPNSHLDGSWESLMYEEDIKAHLLNYVSTIMLFSDMGVDPNIVSFNRVVLLHGPPGTGKTSLCKALAQKIAVRFSNRFRSSTLIEVNAHSLFSKWFSESGKLVQSMFAKVKEYAEDDESFVCVLVDEVESLAAARKAAANGTEPSDSMRAVNAVLTQLDQLKSHRNVLVLTTSNITGAIDVAFVDRADIKLFVGPPGLTARYSILRSCLMELQKRGVLTDRAVLLEAQSVRSQDEHTNCSHLLMECAKKSDGMSGRALRKLPALTYAMHGHACGTEDFVQALWRTIDAEIESRSLLGFDR